MCNQTPSCCCTLVLSRGSGFDDPGTAEWCWEGECTSDKNTARIGGTDKGSKMPNSRVGKFPRAG